MTWLHKDDFPCVVYISQPFSFHRGEKRKQRLCKLTANGIPYRFYFFNNSLLGAQRIKQRYIIPSVCHIILRFLTLIYRCVLHKPVPAGSLSRVGPIWGGKASMCSPLSGRRGSRVNNSNEVRANISACASITFSDKVPLQLP